jgi:hypothetical protein
MGFHSRCKNGEVYCKRKFETVLADVREIARISEGYVTTLSQGVVKKRGNNASLIQKTLQRDT